MAEQAINTVYLLGEQPDLLCGSVIKNLTTRAFDLSQNAPSLEVDKPIEGEDPITPGKAARSRAASNASVQDDSVGAFSLAQLVFAVGHVAMKHIVYLELVEREFKRRKDETAKGKRPWCTA